MIKSCIFKNLSSLKKHIKYTCFETREMERLLWEAGNAFRILSYLQFAIFCPFLLNSEEYTEKVIWSKPCYAASYARQEAWPPRPRQPPTFFATESELHETWKIHADEFPHFAKWPPFYCLKMPIHQGQRQNLGGWVT